MAKTEHEKIREQLNQDVWDQSSDELRKLKMDLYVRGESKGESLPQGIRRQAKTGSLFGKAIAFAAFIGIGYLLYRLGGGISAFLRSLF